jgi:protein-S-isoprenylcysteine O-methyltransferase Ste14
LKLRTSLGIIALVTFVSVLVYWFALNQITVIFSIAAVGYPQDLTYVALNFVLIAAFVLLIGFRRKLARLPASIYLAFILALYIEMYGFPLTMYFFTWATGSGSVATLWYLLTAITGEQLFYQLFLGVIVPVSNVIIITGMLLVIFGWTKIYNAKNSLVTTGIYKHVRHPQYLGFLLITLGMNVLWVTFSTLALWPVLALLYYRLAKEEDKQMEQKFGKQYTEYTKSVPMFIPKLRAS